MENSLVSICVYFDLVKKLNKNMFFLTYKDISIYFPMAKFLEHRYHRCLRTCWLFRPSPPEFLRYLFPQNSGTSPSCLQSGGDSNRCCRSQWPLREYMPVWISCRNLIHCKPCVHTDNFLCKYNCHWRF